MFTGLHNQDPFMDNKLVQTIGWAMDFALAVVGFAILYTAYLVLTFFL